MRAYFFQNMYLQGIHAGIQSQHTTAELFCKYPSGSPQKGMLYEWARKHKTTIIVNGGYSSHLKELLTLLEEHKHDYPYAHFHESNEALNGAITNVGIILPAKIYNHDPDTDPYFILSEFEHAVFNKLKRCRLMT